MKKFEKAEVEIFHFQCEDIITTSGLDHDNGFVDVEDLARVAKEIVDKIFK